MGTIPRADGQGRTHCDYRAHPPELPRPRLAGVRRLTNVVITTILKTSREANSRLPARQVNPAMQIRHTSSVYHMERPAPRTARRTRHIVTRAACYQTRVSAKRGNTGCATERRATCTARARGTHDHGVHVAPGLAAHASTPRPGPRRQSD